MDYITLNNGVKQPNIGFGVYQITDKEQCIKAVLEAIETGYRLIDTAQAYGNEEAVGEAIKQSNVDRSELFITTKVWISNAGYEKAYASVEESLKKMQLDYLDLVLIHQPIGDYYGTYRALEQLYKESKVKVIGVSNFYPDRLVDLSLFNKITPAVNQIEVNLFHQQIDAKEVNDKYGVSVQAWSPFAKGQNGMLEQEEIKLIGDKYGKSVAQVILRWLIQRGITPLTRTVHKERMKENINVFDFTLTDKEMEKIRLLDKKTSSYFSHYDPMQIERLASFAK